MDDSLRSIKRLMEHMPPANPGRPYVNSVVTPHNKKDDTDRFSAAVAGGWNPFNFPADALIIDLLSDSGTGASTLNQLLGIIKGFASNQYGSRPSYYTLLKTIENQFGICISDEELFLAGQGRAAESMFFETLKYLTSRPHEIVIPSNGHFDTTRANIEHARFQAVDIPVKRSAENPFCGNIDLKKLRKLLKKHRGKIPVVFITVTNNTYGGAPVSLENIEKARSLCHEHGSSLFLDACRFAYNAWEIKKHEEGYKNASVGWIVRHMFEFCDGFTISFKKDGLSDTGGALVVKRDAPLARKYPIHRHLRVSQTLKIGNLRQGGMTGRDHYVIAEGLKMMMNEGTLAHQAAVMEHFAYCFRERGIPIVEPVGMHGLYMDVDAVREGTRLKKTDFLGIAITGLLLLRGIRACELGAFAFGKHDPKTGEEISPPFDYIRFAVPRLKYEKDDFEYVADCVAALLKIKDHLPRAVPVSGHKEPLRHFEARFELVPFDK